MAITIKPDSPKTISTTTDNKTVSITKDQKTISISNDTTSVVNVVAQGPRGQKGDTGDTGAQGPQGISGFSGSAESSSISTRLTTAESELSNTLFSGSSQVDHDQTTNFVSDEHIDHSSVTLTAGDGLSGGGDITTNRSFAVDATVLRTTGNNVISSSAQISSDISGSFTNLSSSLSTRLTTDETNITNLQTDSGSFSTRITTEETNVDNLQTDSGSVSTRLTTLEGIDFISSSAQISSDISGSFTEASASFSTRITTAETELENTLISSSAQVDLSQATGTAANATNAVNADNIALSADNTNTNRYVPFTATANGDGTLLTDAGLLYNPNTNTITTTTFNGDLSGNATTATNVAFSGITGKPTLLSGSAQISSDISGSFGNQRVGTTDDVDFASVTTTGNVSVGGNLDVSGTTTSIDSATLNIGDKNITIGSGSTTSVQLDGGGIDIGLGGTIANLRYQHSTTSITSSVDFRAPNFYGIFQGALSSSAQISSDISGSFTAASSSFSTRITTAETELDNTLISSSAQIASDISGSFTSGFEFTGTISGSSTSTGSFGYLIGDAAGIYNLPSAAITSYTNSGDNKIITSVDSVSVQGEDNLTFNGSVLNVTGDMTITGDVSGSSTSTGSFGHLIGGQTATINGFTFPTTDGTDGQALVTDGSGVLTFDDVKVVQVVKNISGVTLQKGTPVHAVGSVGNSVEVIAASASDATTMPATFVLDEQLVDDEEGRAIGTGFINGVNTVGFTEGGVVYVGENGGYTQTKPTGTNLIQNLGIVTKVDANGSGFIYGSGRSNDVPNLLDNTIFYGSGSNQMQQIHISGALQDTTLGYAIFNDRVEASSFTGSLLSTNGVLSSSAQIASDISGSFTAGTGLDLSSGEFSVDVSDFMSNGVDNRVLTATGTDAFNAEANLTFDGNVLVVPHISASGNISGSEGRFSGDVIAFYSSDKRLKDNIIPISNPIEKIKSIGGYEFDWNDNQSTYEGHDIGVIAQEIEEVLPELVTTRDTGYKAVKYEKIIALLIEGIKEQQKQIDELKNKS